MRYCITKDRFIPNEAASYIDYLDTVYHIMNNDEEYKKEYFTKLSEDTNLSFVLEADEYNNLKNAMYNLHEMAYTDRAKLLFTKFKLSSVKSVGMVKSTISSLFSNVNEDDVKTVLKTALKIAFFTFIVLGAFTIAAMASIIGFICYQIYSHFFSNKAELKDAISELRDHRSEVNYKMKSEPDANRKDRMEAYVHELELQINKLQEKYDNMANPSNKVTDTSNTIADTATKIGNAAITGLGIYSAINNFSDMINSNLNLNKAEEGK
jgi:flagellar biosynthesis chaperone FliJ